MSNNGGVKCTHVGHTNCSVAFCFTIALLGGGSGRVWHLALVSTEFCFIFSLLNNMREGEGERERERKIECVSCHILPLNSSITCLSSFKIPYYSLGRSWFLLP